MSEHPADMLPNGTNPYWSVFVAATGGGKAHEFMIWNQREWAEFDARHGYSRDSRSLHGPQFKAELAEKYAAQVEARYRPPSPSNEDR